eukprot:symbB.v1.2.010837.t2/scaffold683.1/size173061/10
MAQDQLATLQGLLQDGKVTVPLEVKEGLEFYISQFEDGQSVSEEEFYIDKELYTQLLAPPEEIVEAPYIRREASAEEMQVVQQLKDWTEVTPQGLLKVKKILEANDSCAEIQEAGITRLGGLLADAKGSGSSVPSGCGLSPVALCPVVMEAMNRFRRDAKVQREFANSLEQMHQLQEVIKFLAPQARQLEAAHQRSTELEQLLRTAQAQAVQKLEELELKHIETNGQLLQLEQQTNAEKKISKEAPEKPLKDLEKLERLLKDAILHGAKLGRSKKDLEEQLAQQKVEQGRLQRRVMQLTQEAAEHQQQRGKYKHRMERMESKIIRQHDRLEDLEADLEDAEMRADRVEERLAEYLRQCTSGGVDAVLEKHLQHVAHAGRQLQSKVEEQEEIIEVLRQLLQNHKDFIRTELGTELELPAEMEGPLAELSTCIVVTDGGCSIVADAQGAARAVEAMKTHLVDVEVCKMGAAVLYAMVQKTDPASPERLMMRTTKAHQVLAEALQYHPTDRALDRACRVTMPELKG